MLQIKIITHLGKIKKTTKNRGVNCTFLKKREKKSAFKEHQFISS